MPSKTANIAGSIQHISGGSDVGLSAFASVDWLPPENQIETVIEHYELALSGSDTNLMTTFKVPASVSLPYYVKVPKGNYTASVRAVDICGHKSELSQTVLNDTSDVYTPPSVSDSVRQQEQKVNGLVAALAVSLFLLCAATIILLGICVLHCKKGGKFTMGDKGDYKNKEQQET